jgi:vacuolar protein sorting-associated protein VTA1
MDGAPLSPGATVVSLDSYVAPDAPPPSAFDDSGETDTTPTDEKPEDESKTLNLPSTPVSLPVAPTIPSAPPPTPHQQPPPSAPPPPTYPTELDSKSIERCQKHARWAISALDYEDLETARKELRLALDLLEGR